MKGGRVAGVQLAGGILQGLLQSMRACGWGCMQLCVYCGSSEFAAFSDYCLLHCSECLRVRFVTSAFPSGHPLIYFAFCTLPADGSTIAASRVVLAVGHSARELYRTLLQHDVAITPKPFAVGFRCVLQAGIGGRPTTGPSAAAPAAGSNSIVANALAKAAPVIACVAAPCCCVALLLACTHACCSPVRPLRIEHPQELINQLQYGAADAAHVLRGKGPYPVAEYRLAAEISAAAAAQAAAATGTSEGSGWLADDWYQPLLASRTDGGAAQSGSGAGVAAEAPAARGVYSFCMCPGKAGLCCAVQLGRSVLAWAGARADCPSDLMRHVSFVRASAFR